MQTPTLSVLIPFYRESPCALIEALLAEAIYEIEIIAYDDGSQDETLRSMCQELASRHPDRVRFLFETQNKGRSAARNALMAIAKAHYRLFLDADMMPATEGFLAQWLKHIDEIKPSVSFGGFKIDTKNQNKSTMVHASMANHSDTKPASERALNPAKSIFTSNLLVHKSVFDTESFDPEFTGWGWEDVEWGLRVAKSCGLHHVDIPAWHLGLDSVPTLIRKYEQSVGNFIRILKKHPDDIMTYPSYRYSKLLSKMPALTLVTKTAKILALSQLLPTRFRGFCLRLFRTSLYAKGLR